MNYSITDIARIIHADIPFLNDSSIEQLLLDSRKLSLPASTLFFALSGPRRNGHQFISDMYKRSVRNFVVSEKIDKELYPGANFLRVSDTLKALQKLAAVHRRLFEIPVIGITGSNGKTIVKEWLYQLLQLDFSIVRSPKSFNSQIGVPLSIWLMDRHHTLGIFEAGISTVGEMKKLERIIRPTIGVLTNIGDAHNEGFKNRRQKLREKIRLFDNADFVVCHSRYNQHNAIGSHLKKGKVFSCGTNADDAVQVVSVNKKMHETFISLKLAPHGERHAEEMLVNIPFTDDASIDNAILCFTVCYLLGSNIETIRYRLQHLYPVEMRMELKKGINNCYIINDSYSNDISSLGIALDYLKQQAGSYPATVILSDILQSGLQEAELFAQVARELKQRNIQRFIGIGERLSAHYEFFKEVAPDTSFYLSTGHFLEAATSHQFREDYVLLKGARSFAFEQISKWLEQKAHQTLLEINLNALAHNLKEYQRYLSPSTRVMAMVKAIGYGSGGAEVAGTLQFHKVDYLGVAYADEGVELRKSGISIPIMVMNPEGNSFEAIVENNLEPEIYSFEMLELFGTYLKKEALKGYPVHVEIETGMNRLGFPLEEMERLGIILKNSSTFKVQSVFSHLAASEDSMQDGFTDLQFAHFTKGANILQEKLGYKFLRHMANSAAINRHPSLHLDMVRLGIGLYGVDSSNSGELDLQTVATLKTTIAQIKHLKAGETVSYNRMSLVHRDSVIATVRLGYADGYPRRLGNGVGSMYVNGKLAPTIGIVCMDMTILDITDIPGVREGDDVIVFGEVLTVEQMAKWAGTIPYEIMTGISQRVKRVYFEE